MQLLLGNRGLLLIGTHCRRSLPTGSGAPRLVSAPLCVKVPRSVLMGGDRGHRHAAIQGGGKRLPSPCSRCTSPASPRSVPVSAQSPHTQGGSSILPRDLLSRLKASVQSARSPLRLGRPWSRDQRCC